MTKLRLDWTPFALLLIDVQRDFWPEKLAECFPDFPANVSRLLALCREQGLEVIHLRASFRPDMSDWMVRYRLRGRIPCVQGTHGVEVLPFAAPLATEKVLYKQSFDGFHSGELLPYLRERGKRFVLVGGLVTSTCVLFTASSAMQLGFLTAVVEDACADEPRIHRQTLDYYQFIFETVTVEEIASRGKTWSAQLTELASSTSATGQSTLEEGE